MKFHGEFLRNLKICEQGFFFDEFYIIHIDIWIDFEKKEVKYIRTLQDLIKLLQSSQKYSQKGHFESWAPIGSWNPLYGKSCIFSKGLTWHRSFQPESTGNGWKIGF